tara:strand:- start:187 stop:384 length:198 start_codon:yes stop_codon:yes gene_type:complete
VEDLTGKLVRIMHPIRSERHITPDQSGKIGIVVSLKYPMTEIKFYRVMTDAGIYTYHESYLEAVS